MDLMLAGLFPFAPVTRVSTSLLYLRNGFEAVLLQVRGVTEKREEKRGQARTGQRGVSQPRK